MGCRTSARDLLFVSKSFLCNTFNHFKKAKPAARPGAGGWQRTALSAGQMHSCQALWHCCESLPILPFFLFGDFLPKNYNPAVNLVS
jgi:hypothetical protein